MSGNITPFKDPTYDKEDHVVGLYKQQHSALHVKSARIVTPENYEPTEIWCLWESALGPDDSNILLERGVITDKNYLWMPIKSEWEDNRKYLNHTYSPDCQLTAYVSESILNCDTRDVIQIHSVKFNKVLTTLVLERDHLHGAVLLKVLSDDYRGMQFSPDNKKLMYFAEPKECQVLTETDAVRTFLVCIYNLETEKISIVTDEAMCMHTIEFFEWTPDSRGVVFLKETELFWHQFGTTEHRKIMHGVRPTGVSFSPDGTKLAIFLTIDPIMDGDSSVILYDWPMTATSKRFSIGFGDYHLWSIPERPWGNDSKHLVMNLYQDTEVRVFVYNVDAQVLSAVKMTRPGTVVDVRGSLLLFQTMTTNSLSRLWVCHLAPDVSNPARMTTDAFVMLSSMKPESDSLWKYNVAEHRFKELGSSVVCAYPMSQFGGDLPMLVIPHHYMDCPAFTVNNRDPIVSTFALLGFFVVVVNYRQPYLLDQVTQLPIYADYSDVDCAHQTISVLLDMYGPLIDRKQVHLWGNRFGAFIVAALITKYPTNYQRALLVRPQLDFPLNPVRRVRDVEIAEDQIFSPLLHADRIVTPTLIITEELVVPYTPVYDQLAQTLYTNGVPVKRITQDFWPFEAYVGNAFFFFRSQTGQFDSDHEAEPETTTTEQQQQQQQPAN